MDATSFWTMLSILVFLFVYFIQHWRGKPNSQDSETPLSAAGAVNRAFKQFDADFTASDSPTLPEPCNSFQPTSAAAAENSAPVVPGSHTSFLSLSAAAAATRGFELCDAEVSAKLWMVLACPEVFSKREANDLLLARADPTK
jgi:hypothetical protein